MATSFISLWKRETDFIKRLPGLEKIEFQIMSHEKLGEVRELASEGSQGSLPFTPVREIVWPGST